MILNAALVALMVVSAHASEPEKVEGAKAEAIASALLGADASTGEIFAGRIRVNRLRCVTASETSQAAGAPAYFCEFLRIGVVDHEPYWSVEGDSAKALIDSLAGVALEDASSGGWMTQSSHVSCRAGFDLNYAQVLSARCEVAQTPAD
jgi:hypothetical protein